MKKLLKMLIPVVMTAGFTLRSAGQTAIGTGTIEGTVISTLTKLPLPGVQISFSNITVPQQGTLPANIEINLPANVVASPALVAELNLVLAGMPQQPTALTDESGHFMVSGLSPGIYTVMAQLEGYFGRDVVSGLYYPRVSTNINVEKSETSSVTFRLIPGGTISGHVRTDRGLPAVDTAVQVLQVTYANGATVAQAGSTRTTDDRGIYRLYGLMPGDYVVAATPAPSPGARGGRGAFPGDPANATASTPALPSPVKTYFPNVIDVSQASQIRLHAGEEISEINIDFQSAIPSRISGQVISSIPPSEMVIPAQAGRGNSPAVPNATLMLYPHDKNALQDPSSTSNVSISLGSPANGQFQLPNVSPGVYDLYASLPDVKGYGPAQPPGRASQPVAYGRTVIDARGNQEGVTVAVHQGVDIKGKVTIDGGSSLNLNNVRISLQADDSASRIPVYQQVGRFQPAIDPDGSFMIPSVPEAQYRIQVTFGSQPGANSYVADILQSGKSVYDSGIFVGDQAVEPLDIRIGSDSGIVNGVVLDAKRIPYAGATVVLVPSTQHRLNPGLHKTATADEAGHFSMAGIRPGEYKLLAWESIPPGNFMNADVLDSYKEAGVSVNVSANSPIDTQVLLIPIHR